MSGEVESVSPNPVKFSNWFILDSNRFLINKIYISKPSKNMFLYIVGWSACLLIH